MSNNRSAYLETALINAVLRNTTYTSPSAVYVGLFTTIPGSDGTGGVEVTGNAYARQSVAFSAPSASGGTATTTNSGLITFPVATGSWGTVTSIGIFDASTSGNLLYFGAVGTSKTVGGGDQVTFPVSSISIGES